jgi:hypothetical protein
MVGSKKMGRIHNAVAMAMICRWDVYSLPYTTWT